MDTVSVVLGLVLGVGIQWLIDVLVHRPKVLRKIPNIDPNEVAALKAQVAEQDDDIGRMAKAIGERDAELNRLRDGAAQYTQQLQAQVEQLRKEVSDRQWRLDAALEEAEAVKKDLTPVVARDIFERIEGIGPVYQQKLWDADILTYLTLSQTDESRLRDIIKPQEWQNLNFTKWRELAAELHERGPE